MAGIIKDLVDEIKRAEKFGKGKQSVFNNVYIYGRNKDILNMVSSRIREQIDCPVVVGEEAPEDFYRINLDVYLARLDVGLNDLVDMIRGVEKSNKNAGGSLAGVCVCGSNKEIVNLVSNRLTGKVDSAVFSGQRNNGFYTIGLDKYLSGVAIGSEQQRRNLQASSSTNYFKI